MVTTTGPEVAPSGTGATILLALQLVGVAMAPLKVTVLDPWVAPKLEPEIVTDVPMGPDIGLRPVILGPAATFTVFVEARQLFVSFDSVTAFA
jgi:hypothetical protein